MFSEPRPKRIQFHANYFKGVEDVTARGMACGDGAAPAQLVAPARAGSNVTYYWSPWVPSHRGPMTSYLAPYAGDLSQVDLNALRFFKIAEDALHADGTWSTDKLIADKGLWTTGLPADIKPGSYVLRHELTALHFATESSNYKYFGGRIPAPQFYISCYALNITGTGTAEPKGETFPGAYKPGEPGLVVNIFKKLDGYRIPGPAVYRAANPGPALKENPLVVVSPTGDPEEDKKYNKKVLDAVAQLGATGSFFNSIGG
jgi:cellulase